jgi:hypothetical protein
MKREFVFGGLMAIALGVGAAAQSTAPQAYPSQDKDKDTVTITGCLMPSSGGAVGTSGTTATTATPPAGGFMLINASKDKGAAATTTAGTSGTTAGTTAGAADAGKSYTLIGGDQADLQKWVNSRVEIKGTVDTTAAPSTAGTTAGTTATSETPDKNPPQRLRVTSAKQIASTCSGE